MVKLKLPPLLLFKLTHVLSLPPSLVNPEDVASSLPSLMNPPVRTDFAGCFGGAGNDTQAMIVDSAMTNDLCIKECGDRGFSVAATRGQTCSCNYDFRLYLPQLSRQDEADAAGPDGYCNKPCGLWEDFNMCDGDRCCGGETAWSVYLVSDIDSTKQVGLRIMANMGRRQEIKGKTLFCRAFNVNNQHCDEAMNAVQYINITVSSKIDSQNRRDCKLWYDESGRIQNDGCNNANLSVDNDKSVVFTVLSYNTQTYYGFPAEKIPIGNLFRMDNNQVDTKSLTEEYDVEYSTTETFSTQSSTSVEIGTSDSISADESTSFSDCISVSNTFKTDMETDTGSDGGMAGIVAEEKIDSSDSTTNSDNTCTDTASDFTNQNTESLTSSSTYELGYENSNTVTTTNSYSVTIDVYGGCSASIQFYQEKQSVRQQWCSSYSAQGNFIAYLNVDDYSKICDTTQTWCQSFLSEFGETNPKDISLFMQSFQFTALGTNEYEDQLSISVEIEMTDVTNYSLQCDADPNYSNNINYDDPVNWIKVYPVIPASWDQVECNENLRYIRELDNYNKTGTLECVRNSVDPTMSECDYHCRTHKEAFNDSPPKIPVDTNPETTGIEITQPIGSVNNNNLCESYDSTFITLECPCPRNYERDSYGELCLVDDFVTDMDYTKWTYFDANGNNEEVETVITPNCDSIVKSGVNLEYTGELDTSNEDQIVRTGTGTLVCSNGDTIFSKNWKNGGIPDGKIARLTVCSSDYTDGTCKNWEGSFLGNVPDCEYGFDYYHVVCSCPENYYYVKGECRESPGLQDRVRELENTVGSFKGTILMWSGSTDSIPDGWAICDGTNGTPDLSGRFVLPPSSNHVVGETGGEELHTLTTDEMPSHSHSFSDKNRSFPNYYGGLGIQQGQSYTADIYTTASYTDSTGESQSHNNMPPYYVLAYIMKI